MDNHTMGIDEWLAILGALGWIFGRRMDLVVQNGPMAHEGAVARVDEDELLGNYEIVLWSTCLVVQLQFAGTGLLWNRQKEDERRDWWNQDLATCSVVSGEGISAQGQHDKLIFKEKPEEKVILCVCVSSASQLIVIFVVFVDALKHMMIMCFIHESSSENMRRYFGKGSDTHYVCLLLLLMTNFLDCRRIARLVYVLLLRLLPLRIPHCDCGFNFYRTAQIDCFVWIGKKIRTIWANTITTWINRDCRNID